MTHLSSGKSEDIPNESFSNMFWVGHSVLPLGGYQYSRLCSTLKSGSGPSNKPPRGTNCHERGNCSNHNRSISTTSPTRFNKNDSHVLYVVCMVHVNSIGYRKPLDDPLISLSAIRLAAVTTRTSSQRIGFRIEPSWGYETMDQNVGKPITWGHTAAASKEQWW